MLFCLINCPRKFPFRTLVTPPFCRAWWTPMFTSTSLVARSGRDSVRRPAPLPHVARTGLPLLVHAELPAPVDAATRRLTGADWSKYSTYLQSRPDEAELSAIRLMLSLCREFHFRLHIVHLATSEALDMLRVAK